MLRSLTLQESKIINFLNLSLCENTVHHGDAAKIFISTYLPVIIIAKNDPTMM